MFSNMEYVYAVYKHNGFSKAAESLYISQPSLSLTVKKIERKLGAQLFDRSTNPIRLTDSGAEYIKCVEKIMDIENGYHNYLDGLNDLQVGNLTIGASNFFASYILPPVITAFKTKYPKVIINLMETNTVNLERQLFSGALDMIVDNNDINGAVYKKHFFYSETLVLAVPRKLMPKKTGTYALSCDDIAAGKHKQLQTLAVPLECFGSVPFILLRQGNDTRTRADKMLEQCAQRPEVILELDQLATAFHIACKGLGATFVSDTLVTEMLPDDRIAYFRLDSDAVSRDNYFYYRHNKYLTRSMEEFLAVSHRKVSDA